MAKRTCVVLNLFLAGVTLAACAGSRPIVLGSAEIREYQGEDLSSIDDFRENSIRGPQYVSLDDYGLEITGLVDRPSVLTYDQVLDREHYGKVVTLHCVEGWRVNILWEGVLLEDLLNQLGVKDGAITVVFQAAIATALPCHWSTSGRSRSCWRIR